VLDKKNRFLLVCILKIWGPAKIKDFWEILWLVSQKIVYKLLHKQTKTKIYFFLLTSEKYLAVFTEYLVAEYSADHHLAEYSADRIVGRS
jgi:hypothetical protein